MMNPTLLRSYFSLKSNDNFVKILGSILEELLPSVNSVGALVISQTNHCLLILITIKQLLSFNIS